MATNNRISATLSAADVTAIQTAIATIKSKLPFLISLDKSERLSLRKMAQKRTGYFIDVANGVNAFPNHLPSSFPLAEFTKDANLMDALMQFTPQLLGLAANLSDTTMQLGSELLTTSDRGYEVLKFAAKSDSNVKPTVQKIAAGLKQAKKKAILSNKVCKY